MQTLRFFSAAMNGVHTKNWVYPNNIRLSYNPQGNGLVELLNKTLIDTLSHLVSEKQEDWCQHVPLALMAFKCTSPFNPGNAGFSRFMVEICKCLMILYFVIRLGRTLIRLLLQLNWLIGFSLLFRLSKTTSRKIS
ncbi:integrase catalytic domain-containing protein [Caerostris extrusa]|uniref:Integrase catalytic domain-containing protein n=1 Tax=Caerostris extrusa TaxID=172846 RepID=A0AAV4W9Z9_CAEEX|nr:integrase catalytic domain-containing protein [Caerostris extrusa]